MSTTEDVSAVGRRFDEVVMEFFEQVVSKGWISLKDPGFAEIVVSALKPEHKAALLGNLELPRQSEFLRPHVDAILLAALTAGRLTATDVQEFHLSDRGEAFSAWLRRRRNPDTGTSGV